MTNDARLPTPGRDRAADAPGISRLWRRRRSGGDAVPAVRRDTHITPAQSPARTGIDARIPASMPRAEDDATTGAGDRDVHDQPGSGRDTGRRHFYF